MGEHLADGARVALGGGTFAFMQLSTANDLVKLAIGLVTLVVLTLRAIQLFRDLNKKDK